MWRIIEGAGVGMGFLYDYSYTVVYLVLCGRSTRNNLKVVSGKTGMRV
jgi:hypothetical protein